MVETMLSPTRAMTVSSWALPAVPIQVASHRHPRPYLHLDAVFGDPINGVAAFDHAIDDLWVDGGANCFQDGFAGSAGGKINGAKRDPKPIRCSPWMRR